MLPLVSERSEDIQKQRSHNQMECSINVHINIFKTFKKLYVLNVQRTFRNNIFIT